MWVHKQKDVIHLLLHCCLFFSECSLCTELLTPWHCMFCASRTTPLTSLRLQNKYQFDLHKNHEWAQKQKYTQTNKKTYYRQSAMQILGHSRLTSHHAANNLLTGRKTCSQPEKDREKSTLGSRLKSTKVFSIL